MILTPAQKAAQTRKRNTAARAAKDKHKHEVIAALEKILCDEQSSCEARENALMLLTMVYQ